MANITPRCWNCGDADKWTEVVAIEKCDNCGIACVYHGSGANQAYLDAMDERDARAERLAAEAEEQDRLRELEREREVNEYGYINTVQYY